MRVPLCVCVSETGVAVVSEEKIERSRVQGAELYCIPETGVAVVSEEKIERSRVQGAELYCIPEVSPVGCISTDFELSETHGCLNPQFKQLPRISQESVMDGTSSSATHILVGPQVDQYLTEVVMDAAISSKGHSMLEHVKGFSDSSSGARSDRGDGSSKEHALCHETGQSCRARHEEDRLDVGPTGS